MKNGSKLVEVKMMLVVTGGPWPPPGVSQLQTYVTHHQLRSSKFI